MQSKRKKMSNTAKDNLLIASVVAALVGIPATIMIALESEYKYLEGDHVNLLIGERSGVINDVLYTNLWHVPKYSVRFTDETGKPHEIEFYESEIKGLVKKVN
jgi:hypothetical protein